ncbi:MAG: serine/threonine protein kinase [Polyangiaceae bacterium]|nr:serine/threonine protein kinase [Polyangiaceae bacterium]
MALGPYVLVAPIGAGGMARVWVASVQGTRQLAAVKVLLAQLAENVSFRQMFFDEASIASRVRHPNVCATFELGQHDRTLYIAMEWVDGPSLMRVLRPGPATSVTGAENDDAPRIPIRPRLAARIVADVCAGLHAAHELVGNDGRPLGVVHRDVSPHNILITSDGYIKVTDFGVAKALGKSHMTVAGQLKGKLAYMSPEQLMGATVDRRADVFALGCVLYEITTGQRPFVGEHDPQVMAQIMMGHYELPSTFVAGYPLSLEAIVERALRSDPEQRFESAEHMRQALEAYLRESGPPVTSIQIAELLRERCGKDIDDRARLVAKLWTAQPASGPRVVSAAARERTPSFDADAVPFARPRPDRRSLLMFTLAVLLGAGLGFVVLAYVHSTRKGHAQQTPSTAEVTGPTAPGTAPSTVTDATVEPSNPTSDTQRPAIRSIVHFHVKPESAILLIGNIALPPGARSIARPDDGGTVSVLFRADKHEDKTIVVNHDTADNVNVELTPIRPPRTAPPRKNNGGAEGAAPGPPPNPY